jgi:hypothetical protein
VPDGGKYISAFDKDKDGEWRFMSARDSAEQQLVATGG